MKTENVQITYMGITFSLKDYIDYHLEGCFHISKLGALSRIKPIVNQLSFSSVDDVAEILVTDLDSANFVLLKIIADKDLVEVPDYLPNVLDTSDDDMKYDGVIKFATAYL